MAINPVFGTVAQTQTILSNINSVRNNSTPSPTDTQSTLSIIPVRVKKIILDNSDQELFTEFGEWNGIGIIFWEPLDLNYSDKIEYIKGNFASPIFPNIKQYPLLNEVVYIISLPSSNNSNQGIANKYYYFPPLNIWNNQLHNALPETNNTANDAAQNQDYISSFQGKVRRPEDNSTEIDLGSTFVEANSIKVNPLLPYEGDIIYEGRFGNSIRLGSTVNNAKIENSWSSEGENGAPITIIMNGQEEVDIDPWIPIPENINGDLSSIYMTSTQKLPIEPASNLIESYAKSTAPDGPSVYNKNQILLTSGRLLFNAKDDAIILGAKKSIHLTADDSINIDGMNYIALTSNKVYLGSSQGSEEVELQSAVLGENLHAVLTKIYTDLSTLSSQFKGAIDSIQGPIAVLQGPSSILLDDLSKYIKEQVDNDYILSENVRISKRK
jgi:hypothetical protein